MSDKILKYLSIKNKIIEKIDNEEYEVGSLIPSERELMDIFQMSRITVRKAIDDLVNEGYLYRVQGKGTYVKNVDVRHDLFSITSCTEDIKARGMTASNRVILSEPVSADKNTAKKLRINENEPVLKLKRVFFANDVPINLTTTYLPLTIFPGLEKHDFSKESLYAVIENKYGIKITHAVRTLEAILADSESAELLKIKQGQPLILFSCVTYGEVYGKEKIIEAFKCLYRSDMHKFYINQVR
jgi:GntR family transcriptional regulator